jgi:hypothetical protein
MLFMNNEEMVYKGGWVYKFQLSVNLDKFERMIVVRIKHFE